MDIFKINDLLKKINFDDYYLEATFQFKLLMQLGKEYDENKIFPERNIKAYGLKVKDYTKKEIDIVIEQENNSNIAIELKMPMNRQVPDQMFKFIEDIKFLEELNASKLFNKCYLIVVTNEKLFWEGDEMTEGTDIYKYFRNSKEILKGEIFKPTGEGKGEKFHKLNDEYNVQWNYLNNGFRYFVIEINKVIKDKEFIYDNKKYIARSYLRNHHHPYYKILLKDNEEQKINSRDIARKYLHSLGIEIDPNMNTHSTVKKIIDILEQEDMAKKI